MVSAGISKLSLKDTIFVDPGIKINSGYYCDMLLSQQLLPVMPDVSGDFFISQTRHCDFLSYQHPLLFLQICGH